MVKERKIVLSTVALLLLSQLTLADSLTVSENNETDSAMEQVKVEERVPDEDSIAAPAKNETVADSGTMRDTILELDKMTIPGEKAERDVLSVSKEISSINVAPEELGKLPNMGEQDISRTLQLMPGVSGADESSSALFIRGGTPDQNLIQYDGFTLFYLDHFYGFFSPFNTNAVKDVQLYKGGYPARYGSRASSVMMVNGKTADYDHFRLGGNVNFLSANAHIEVPLFSKGSVLIAGRRSYTDIIESSVYKKIFGMLDEGSPSVLEGIDENAVDENTPIFHFYDFNTKIAVSPSAKDTFSFNLYLGKDVLDQIRDRKIMQDTTVTGRAVHDDKTHWGNKAFSLMWDRKWHERLLNTVTVSRSNYFTEIGLDFTWDGPNNAQRNSAEEENQVTELAARINTEYAYNKYNTFNFGIDISKTDITLNSIFNQLDIFEADTVFDHTFIDADYHNSAIQVSSYLEDKCTFFNDRLTLQPGLRCTYYSKYIDFFLDPRMSLHFKITDSLAVKGAVGIYHQFIQRISRKNFIYDNSGDLYFWFLSDKDPPPNYGPFTDMSEYWKPIPVIRADHFIAGINYSIFGFHLDIEGFYKKLNNLAMFQDYVGYSKLLFTQGEGVSQGVEFLLKKKFKAYTGWIGYTLSKVEYTFPNLNEGKPFRADHDRPHEINFVNMVSKKINDRVTVDLSGTWVYATGRPYTKPIGQMAFNLMNQGPSEFPEYIGIYSPKNVYRYPDYHRLDLALSWNFLLAGKYNTGIGISAFNVYNNKNLWKKQYRLNTNKNLIETDVSYLGVGITPCLFLKLNFK